MAKFCVSKNIILNHFYSLHNGVMHGNLFVLRGKYDGKVLV